MNDRHRRVQRLRRQQAATERRQVNREFQAQIKAIGRLCKGMQVTFKQFGDSLHVFAQVVGSISK